MGEHFFFFENVAQFRVQRGLRPPKWGHMLISNCLGLDGMVFSINILLRQRLYKNYHIKWPKTG